MWSDVSSPACRFINFSHARTHNSIWWNGLLAQTFNPLSCFLRPCWWFTTDNGPAAQKWHFLIITSWTRRMHDKWLSLSLIHSVQHNQFFVFVYFSYPLCASNLSDGCLCSVCSHSKSWTQNFLCAFYSLLTLTGHNLLKNTMSQEFLRGVKFYVACFRPRVAQSG